MEKLLTTDAETFSRFLKKSDNPAPSEAGNKQAYHYTKVGDGSLSRVVKTE